MLNLRDASDAQHQEETARLRNEITALMSEHEQLVAVSAGKCASLTSDMDRLRTENDSLEQKLRVALAVSESLQEQAKAAEKNLSATFRSQHESLTQKVQTLAGELERRAESVGRLENELKTTRDEVETTKAILDRSVSQERASAARCIELEAKVNEVNCQRQALADEMESLRVDLARASGSIAEMEVQQRVSFGLSFGFSCLTDGVKPRNIAPSRCAGECRGPI
jgi:SMC interacting uncharacterized protein involved in chromosome segregation